MLGGEKIHTGTPGGLVRSYPLPSRPGFLRAWQWAGNTRRGQRGEATATSSATPVWPDRHIPPTVLEDGESASPPAAGAHRLQGAAPEPDRGGGRGRQALQLPEAWAPLGLRGQHLGPGVQGSSNSAHPPLGAHTAPGLRGARRSVGNSEPPMGEGRHFARPPSSGPGLDPCAQLAQGL